MMRGAFREAEIHLSQAIAALSTTPETPERMNREFNLQSALYQVLAIMGGPFTGESERASRRMRELGEMTGNPEQLILVLSAAWDSTSGQGEWTAKQQIAEQMLEIAQRGGSRKGLTLAHFFQGIFFAMRGELTQAMQHYAAAITSYNEADWSGSIQGDPHVVALSQIGMVLWHFGSADQGRAKIRESISLSERLKSPTHMAISLMLASSFYMDLREPGNVDEVAERLCTLASEQQLAQFGTIGSVYRGWAMAEQGRTDEGLALIRAGLVSSVTFFRSLAIPALIEALARAGQLEEALATIEQDFFAVGEMQIRLPYVLWWRGELHLRRGDETKAAGDFRETIAVARRIGSKAYELRATTSLARLLDRQGKRDDARTMLAEIYNWFTEGFDTADLKDAKALLEQLSG
ncbi:MAG TPA: hypothetical protein VIX59_08460 [Candidatus Binataceae bacterium]